MKLLPLLLLLLYGCNSNHQTVVTHSMVKVPAPKPNPLLTRHQPITTSLEQLQSDIAEPEAHSLNGKYMVAGKYEVDVKISDRVAEINWVGFKRINYKNETCPYSNIICLSSPNGDYGKFYINIDNGKAIHQVITKPGDTTYYNVRRMVEERPTVSDFSGMYSIIAPNTDSVKFAIKAVKPFHYEYQPSEGKKSVVYYKGKDKHGLMHYSNSIAMNSDHLSGLYNWQDANNNSTIVRLASN